MPKSSSRFARGTGAAAALRPSRAKSPYQPHRAACPYRSAAVGRAARLPSPPA